MRQRNRTLSFAPFHSLLSTLIEFSLAHCCSFLFFLLSLRAQLWFVAHIHERSPRRADAFHHLYLLKLQIPFCGLAEPLLLRLQILSCRLRSCRLCSNISTDKRHHVYWTQSIGCIPLQLLSLSRFAYSLISSFFPKRNAFDHLARPAGHCRCSRPLVPGGSPVLERRRLGLRISTSLYICLDTFIEE